MADSNAYPAWIDAKTEITDAHPIPFVKFKLAIPFPNFKSRDRLWITDDNFLITYICDPGDIAQNARKARNIKVRFALSKIVDVAMTQREGIFIITIECSTEIIVAKRQKLGKILFFFFRDADKAVELKNIIRSNSENIRLSSSPTSSDDGAGTADPRSSQLATRNGNNGSIHPGANGSHPGANGSTSRSVTFTQGAPQIIAEESDKGDDDDDHDDDQTLVLPFGTQIPRRRASSLPTTTQPKVPTILQENTNLFPQPDHEDDVQDLLQYEEVRDLQATVEALAIQAGKKWVKDQKRVHEKQKMLHKIFWQKVEEGKRAREKELHTIGKAFVDKVPSAVRKSKSFHQTLQNGFTTFPNITRSITHAIEAMEKESMSLATLKPNFDD
ncbi:uncharacterized protein FA14DRAFT_153145 [Meira miltonrushii]|uniref:Uncharacterized protein n=1 Tax=Meira miltonrushii TaxID=1280837 RepID=A0A316VJK8_9BASI|nr:uncharacterized protein FA14DRAFT_153145 [Meira miltonrushii]PWN37789.1 hypothetical protein FA14DRAFT_153145 [Meira miltonrushii]